MEEKTKDEQTQQVGLNFSNQKNDEQLEGQVNF